MTPAFHSAHQVGGPHSSYCFLGSARCKGECKVFRTGGVYIVHMLEWKLRMQRQKAFHHAQAVHSPHFKK